MTRSGLKKNAFSGFWGGKGGAGGGIVPNFLSGTVSTYLGMIAWSAQVVEITLQWDSRVLFHVRLHADGIKNDVSRAQWFPYLLRVIFGKQVQQKALHRRCSAGPPNVIVRQSWKKSRSFLTSSLLFIITITMPDTYHDKEHRISEMIQSTTSQTKPISPKLLANIIFLHQDLKIIGMVADQNIRW